MGGMISILQAAAQPGTVTGLVLVDPALPQLRITGRHPMVALSFLASTLPGISAAVLAGRRRHTSPEQAVAQMLRLCCAEPAKIPPDLVADSVQLVRERLSYPGADGDVLAAALSLIRILVAHHRYEAKMRAITAPVLLIHGDSDRLVSLASARIASAANPGWRFEIARGVGHVPQLESPDWTVAIILDWLARDTGLVDRSSA
jgi:pimeloyl-ACP methyl ester carboxylesterase